MISSQTNLKKKLVKQELLFQCSSKKNTGNNSLKFSFEEIKDDETILTHSFHN